MQEERKGGERREETESEFKRGKSILFCREAKRRRRKGKEVGRGEGSRKAENGRRRKGW